MRLRSSRLWLALVVLLAACEGAAEAPSGVDAAAGVDVASERADVAPDTGAALPELPAVVGELHFVQEVGDDGRSCAEEDSCRLLCEGPDLRDLAVRYTRGGEPVEGALVRYLITEDEHYWGEIDPGSGLATTNVEGVALSRLKIGSPTPMHPNPCLGGGGLSVEVSVVEAPGLRSLRFDVSFTGECP